MKGVLLEVTGSCVWTKDPARHEETWRLNDDVSHVNEKLGKEWKIGSIRRSIYKQRRKLEGLFTKPNEKHKGKDLETLNYEMIRNLKIKKIVKTNQDIIGTQYIRNNNGLLIVSDEDNNVARTS